MKGEEYYFDYVNNLFSELMTRYKYVTYETDYKTVRHDLLYIDDYRLVSESDNLDNYMSEYENLHFGYYGFEFKAIVADKIYYPNDEFYPGKGKATKMKKSTIITVRLSIPLNYDADAMHKDTLLSIIVDKNDDCSYLEQYIQY